MAAFRERKSDCMQLQATVIVIQPRAMNAVSTLSDLRNFES